MIVDRASIENAAKVGRYSDVLVRTSEALNLFDNMMSEQSTHDARCKRNIDQMQQDCGTWLHECYSLLSMSTDTGSIHEHVNPMNAEVKSWASHIIQRSWRSRRSRSQGNIFSDCQIYADSAASADVAPGSPMNAEVKSWASHIIQRSWRSTRSRSRGNILSDHEMNTDNADASTADQAHDESMNAEVKSWIQRSWRNTRARSEKNVFSDHETNSASAAASVHQAPDVTASLVADEVEYTGPFWCLRSCFVLLRKVS